MVHKVWRGAVAFGVALTMGLPAFGDNVPYRMPVQRALIEDAVMLDDEYRRANFDLAMTRKTGVVPRFFLNRLPRDLSALQGKARQEAFIRIVLPLVVKANEIIARQRARYLAIARAEAEGGFLTRNERAWLLEFSKLYNVRATRPDDGAARIDVIPPSLVIAHAIQASDWGANVPAIENNVLFGHYAKLGETGFPSLLNGVMAQLHRVNTHRRFAEFRKMRARARASDRPLSGPALAGAFKAGARDLGDALVTLMRRHDLAALDSARLPRDTGATLVAMTAEEPILEEKMKEPRDESLDPNLYYDPKWQDPSDRFVEFPPTDRSVEVLR